MIQPLQIFPRYPAVHWAYSGLESCGLVWLGIWLMLYQAPERNRWLTWRHSELLVKGGKQREFKCYAR